MNFSELSHQAEIRDSSPLPKHVPIVRGLEKSLAPRVVIVVGDGLLASLKMVLDLRGEHRALIIGVQ